MNVAEFMLEQLAAWGVRHIYGVTGDAILPLMDAVARQDALRFVPVGHEAAAGLMASAEAKLTGRLAVCIGTSGPGLGNLINGIGDAYGDRVPLLVLTGQVESYKVGTAVKQEVNPLAMTQALAGYSAQLTGPGAAPQVLLRALMTALGEGRVAHISVPKDYWQAEVSASIRPPSPYLKAPPVPDPEVVAGTAALLRKAHRPLILAGHGARGAAGALLEVARVWGAGIVLSLGGKGMVPGDDPLVLGGVGTGGSDAAHTALKECDLLLVVGSTWWPQEYMPSGVPVVQVDRSPMNIGAKAEVAYGLAGESQHVLPALAQALAGDAGPDRGQWQERLGELKAKWQAVLDQEAAIGLGPEGDGQVHPAVIVRALESVTSPGAILTLDTGDHLVWFNRHFPGNGQRVLFSGTWRTMGFALPAASAAKLCAPESQVIALVGDGGLTMTLGEFSVPVRELLDLTVVVFRNGVLGMEEHKARSEGLQPFGHVLQNPDFAGVARAFGWQAWRVEGPGELAGALAEAVAYRGPALVDVATVNDGSIHTSTHT